MALDAEGELYAVVLSSGRELPAEARVGTRRSGVELPQARWDPLKLR